MRAGEFPQGSRVLRAKIDMASPFMVLRDPVMYRILYAEHPRTGDAWCIYPTYDWAHGQSDSIEGITHSICTLEFENNRRLYDWFQEALGIPRSQQIEFARLFLTYTVMSKRKLLKLVKEGYVSGWDDPRMPTLRGLRRRGFTPEAIKAFTDQIGVSKANSVVEWEVLENAVREDLNAHAPRAMAVLDPVKVVIENYPGGQEEWFDVSAFPQDKARTETRRVPFSREVYIERDDFMENPVKGFFRLAPETEVRLMGAYYIACTGVAKDEAGNVTEIRAVYDPATRGGNSPDGRKVKGTLHWVSAAHAQTAEVRLYGSLFTKPFPEEGGDDFLQNLDPDSLKVVTALVEPSLAEAGPVSHFQFIRHGYFTVDSVDSRPDHLVFNRTVTLRSSWEKQKG
jgi:glutaminyl-tRNA synthetase